MGILTEDMRRMVNDQKLGFVATVNPDGKPNLSPKGTTRVWDQDHIIFADIGAPDTVAGLRGNPAIEICVLDQDTRAGWRFRGLGIVLSEGALFHQIRSHFAGGEAEPSFPHIILMTVEQAIALASPGRR